MKYYINTIQNLVDDNELHIENCQYLQSNNNRKYIGLFETESQALKEAKKKYPFVNGCEYCCASIHTSKCGLMGLYY